MIPFPQPGRMRHLVQVQRREAGTGSRGQLTGTWVDVGPAVFANFKTLRGAEVDAARSKWEEAQVQIQLYYGSGGLDTSENRIIFEGKTYQLGWIDDVDNMHSQINVLAKEYPR